jgi:hypothetical protein
MKIFRINISKDPDLKEIEELIKKVKQIQSNELEFNEIVDLYSLLDIEYKPELNNGGSHVKFYCKYLEKVPNYSHGIFSLPIKHGGGSKRIVYRKNFLDSVRHLELIITIKRSKK